jgi:hypothetical protein
MVKLDLKLSLQGAGEEQGSPTEDEHTGDNKSGNAGVAIQNVNCGRGDSCHGKSLRPVTVACVKSAPPRE